MPVSFANMEEGIVTTFSVACITWLGLASDILNFWVRLCCREACQECWQVSWEQRQSTAVWLWKRRIGRTLLPATGLSWQICYSCRFLYSKYVIQRLKKTKRRLWFLEESSSTPVTASLLFLQPVPDEAKKKFPLSRSLNGDPSRILEGKSSASTKGKFKMPWRLYI